MFRFLIDKNLTGNIIKYENEFQFEQKGIVMNRIDSYKTKQREQILAVVKDKVGAFSAKELHQTLNGKIGLVTIYRFLRKNKASGSLVSFSKNNTTFYQYSDRCEKTDHFYLKCDNCGKLEYVDCKKIRGLNNHIMEKHHFKVLNDFIIINGVCENCY